MTSQPRSGIPKRLDERFTLTAAAGSTLLVASQCSAPAAIGAPLAHASALRTADICAVAAKGYAHCDAQVVVDSVGKPAVASAPKGLGPADIRSAYALSASAGAGRTVAIIDAYNDPTAESDLAAYRKNYGLVACTSASGCFRKVNQTGGATLPKTDAGWATEISLDLDMVSAACPACKILLVEATSSSLANLGVAVNYAATQHVVAISNSYGAQTPARTRPTTTRESPSPPPPVTTATASSRRPATAPWSPSAAPA